MAFLSVVGYFLITLICIILLFIAVLVLKTKKRPSLDRFESEKYYLDPKNNSKNLFPSLNEDSSIDLSIIVPSYNEEERLPVMLNEAMEYLIDRKKKSPDFSYEIIIVDDGSKDKTTEVALLYSEKYGTNRVRVLTFEKNRGKGGAIRMGIFSCRGDLILFADADGASQFSDIKSLEQKMSSLNIKEDKRAIVCGSRAHMAEEAVAERSVFRTVLMYGFHFLVWFLCVKGIKDTQCGFKLLSREAARIVFYNMHVERWAFDVDMLYIAEALGIPVTEVAINWQEIEGTKMVPVWSWLQMGRDLLLIRLRYMLGIWTIEDKVKVE